MPRSHRLAPILSVALLAWATHAAAESSIVLPLPPRFEEIAATTYDAETGKAVGGGFIRFERRGETGARMEGATGIDGGAHTNLLAEFAVLPGDGGLRLLRQESRSVDVAGQAMGVLEIDHRAGEGRCTGPSLGGDPPETRTVELPADDRLVNVPMNLLFQPIVRGERQEIRFQILLCGGGPRIVTAVARVAETEAQSVDGSRLVRIRYELSLPKLLSRMVARWLPHLSFWFDPDEAGAWIGNEMPLYSKGPTVLVVRRGFTPALLDALP
ncbi:MAG TPA: hypothetical protein VKB65_04945 [Myxococcota bacterium]|nr:hypothetical protein [Myxococcota bacterium]